MSIWSDLNEWYSENLPKTFPETIASSTLALYDTRTQIQPELASKDAFTQGATTRNPVNIQEGVPLGLNNIFSSLKWSSFAVLGVLGYLAYKKVKKVV